MYGIIDCDNCYVSCERVFHPDLNGKPVVVLSNNDGCIVARSNEAKRMGIKAGMPYFQLAQQFPKEKIAVFSSNYELYGEMTGRVMEIIRQEAPNHFRYSIDECFVNLDIMKDSDLKEWGTRLHERVVKSTGMPISIGIAANKTLAKIASRFAKKHPGYHHCCIIGNERQRIKALSLTDISDVWGIGRRYAARLMQMGIETAADFASKPEEWVNATFRNVCILRTWKELNGEDCVPDETLAMKKSICTSRSFSKRVSDIQTIKTHVDNFATLCASKLRSQKSVASIICVFINTDPFRDDLGQYWNSCDIQLATPTNSTMTIVKAANKALERIFRPGYQYKKAGVIVMGINPDSPLQLNLFDTNAEDIQRMRRLDTIIDRLNKCCGKDTVILATSQYPKQNGIAVTFCNAIRRDHISPNPTTRWSDIIRLK